MGMPFPGSVKVQKDIIYFDPLVFLLVLFLGVLPVSLIAVLQQNNAVIVAKSALIMVMGGMGLIVAVMLGLVKQVQIKWVGFQYLINKSMGLLVLLLLAATYLSQFLVGVGTGITFGIVDVLQAKLYYGGVGIFEEALFGIGLFLVPNALLDNQYWTAFNFVLNPILFGIYHLFVLQSPVALLYVIIPRIIWNFIYLFWAMPSIIMLTHFTWNWLVATLSALAMSVVIFPTSSIIMPCLLLVGLMSCNPRLFKLKIVTVTTRVRNFRNIHIAMWQVMSERRVGA